MTTLKDIYTAHELPQTLQDLSQIIDMVDGWVLRNEPIQPEYAHYAALLMASIAQRVEVG